MKADAVVRARIPADTKDKAIEALDKMGLSASDLIRLTFFRVAEEGKLPFEVSVPNKTTRKAVADHKAGKVKQYESADELFKDLGI